VLLRFETPSAGPEVLLMQRARRSGDRWSGHVSFPGGHEEARDANLEATARRETREELGLDLARCARPIGRLDATLALPRGRVRPMLVVPYVFATLPGASPQSTALKLGLEATEAFWLPLEAAARGALDGVHRWRVGPLTLKMSCWRYEGRLVWGLTYMMLRGLLRLVR
jgi:8-oxo-dGTP pyrophosphatase MutT (NUDIX family)